ncbi:pantetheine-phosphate adenylyltransferase [Sutterella massiliensis]|uniref:Phosphopantetheine adenylyltransferase n=1 Tax=Sutterella massiliensis TaxID=1816689 RepID=A0ABS2DNS8_9BURK|nr:pantetheine-phosphate adenylyltransferase [Sutterella massiliensis]MBM6703005.1 pantetheine-phosphate adenylyltransferase [Sutterella massiliensis]
MTTVVYPGTFDPMTRGHEDIVRRAAKLFPKVIVAVAKSSGKHPLLTLEERLRAAEAACSEISNVEVRAFEGLLKNFVLENGIDAIVRGARAVSDFEYEFQMAGMNRRLMPNVETVFLTPSDDYQFVSGTFVREIALLGGADASQFVPPAVWPILQTAADRARKAKHG